MVASDLKVYRDTFELIVNLIEFQTYFSKMFKYTLGGRIQEDAYPLFRFIQSANMCVGENRIKFLNGFIVQFETLKTDLRLAAVLKQISIKQQAKIFQYINGIGRQISAWKGSEQKKIQKNLNQNRQTEQ